MIVSHRHRFIFQHCRKTAGSSIQVSLFRYLGPNDVSTDGWGDAMSIGVRPNARAAWWVVRPPGTLRLVREALKGRGTVSQAMNASFKATAAHYLGVPRESTHVTARELRDRFHRQWEGYFKFCFVRNPYSRVVSDYFWRTRQVVPKPTFRQYLIAMADGDDLAGVISPFFDNWPLYTIDDQVAVDRVCRFERLLPDLAAALEEAGVPWDGWLPRLKQGGMSTSYRALYGAEERAMVAELFKREIDMFGYEW
jgi:hypothetical protein